MLKEARNDKKECLISLGWCFFRVDDAISEISLDSFRYFRSPRTAKAEI